MLVGTSFFDPSLEGVVHHIHSQNNTIEVIYETASEEKFYLLNLNKKYLVDKITPIGYEGSFLGFEKWHKTVITSRGEFVHSGCLEKDDGFYKFSIKNDEIVLQEKIQLNRDFAFDNLNAFKNVEVEHHIQKANTIYAVGVDIATRLQVFVESHIGLNKAQRRYSLESDEGEIFVLSLCIDPANNVIYLVGKVHLHTNDRLSTRIKPYFEILTYNKP